MRDNQPPGREHRGAAQPASVPLGLLLLLVTAGMLACGGLWTYILITRPAALARATVTPIFVVITPGGAPAAAAQPQATTTIAVPLQATATFPPPPEFDVEAWQVSLARLMQLDLQCMYLTHFGAVTDVRAHLEELASLVISAADFVRGRLKAGIPRETLLAEYIAWNRVRALETGLKEEDWQRFEAANPIYMSVDGITRYWTKKWETK